MTIRFADVEVYENLVKPAFKLSGDENHAFRRLAGGSRDFCAALDPAKIAAANPMPALLYGETGVSKELSPTAFMTRRTARINPSFRITAQPFQNPCSKA